MNIGIYISLEVVMTQNTEHMKKEGLFRYLILLVKAMHHEGNSITIACPKWAEKSLGKLFRDCNIDNSEIRYLTINKIPFSVKLYLWFTKQRVKRVGRLAKFLLKLKSFVLNGVKLIIKKLLITQSIIVFLGLATLLFILGIIFSTFIFPVLAVFLLFYKFNERIAKRYKFFKKIQACILSFKKHLLGIKARFSRQALRVISRHAGKLLVEKVNKQKELIDIWFCPFAFAPEFCQIEGVRVNGIPDLVTAEFPSLYSSDGFSIVINDNMIKKTIEQGKYFITYSEHVKREILIKKFGVKKENIIAIQQFSNDLYHEINVKEFYDFNYDFDANKHYARQCLHSACLYSDKLTSKYLNSYSIFDMKYIFYASQIRASKNILNLIKAYEYLLRRDKISCKLVLTGNLSGNASIFEYINKHQLNYDVISFFSIPDKILASLYACADLVVNPTLHEGGFPFTFSEGISVGTPSVMGDIEQVREILDGFALEDCLFDPHDYLDIADKILYALENREQLVQRQKSVYEQIKFAPEGKGAKAYHEAFEYFIAVDKQASLKT